ncbi:predicted protein [Histoplasma mississippiense (nom. inval.)]|uniref:predicted protein n=1 Tax=Ajellomyces capsulatus (strain NAm1 / WU24) TaxID=2059318 RepID=UPI000157B2F0|nr:predicted protein [Histoplasma mississippiense (nom. inval.)]EDN02166.1 predicted protein [Histoplasma mississippiense (nom. inval.)]
MQKLMKQVKQQQHRISHDLNRVIHAGENLALDKEILLIENRQLQQALNQERRHRKRGRAMGLLDPSNPSLAQFFSPAKVQSIREQMTAAEATKKDEQALDGAEGSSPGSKEQKEMDKAARAAQRQIEKELRDARKAQEQKEKEEQATARQQSRLEKARIEESKNHLPNQESRPSISQRVAKSRFQSKARVPTDPLPEDSDDIAIPTDLMTACSLNLPPPPDFAFRASRVAGSHSSRVVSSYFSLLQDGLRASWASDLGPLTSVQCDSPQCLSISQRVAIPQRYGHNLTVIKFVHTEPSFGLANSDSGTTRGPGSQGNYTPREKSRDKSKKHTSSPSAYLISVLENCGYDVSIAKPKSHSVDLSYNSPLATTRSSMKPRRKTKVKSSRYPNARLACATVVADYLRYVHPLLESEPSGPISNQRFDKTLDNALLTVFNDEVVQYLSDRGYSIDDVMAWAWILTSSQPLQAAMRYKIFEKKASENSLESAKVPLFVLLFTLRRESICATAFRILLFQAWDILSDNLSNDQTSEISSGPKRSAWNRSGDDNTIMILAVRLLRLAGQLWPQAFPSIAALITRTLGTASAANKSSEAYEKKIRGLTIYYNKLLSLLAMPCRLEPYRSAIFQQRAQFQLLREMSKFNPPLPVTREGYQAITNVQLAQKKTSLERQWANFKAQSWPPWKEEKLGIDFERGNEGSESRALKSISHMRDVGYGMTAWEQTAAIYAGWDTDKTPTIQTRTFLPKPNRFRLSSFSGQTSTQPSSRTGVEYLLISNLSDQQKSALVSGLFRGQLVNEKSLADVPDDIFAAFIQLLSWSNFLSGLATDRVKFSNHKISIPMQRVISWWEVCHVLTWMQDANIPLESRGFEIACSALSRLILAARQDMEGAEHGLKIVENVTGQKYGSPESLSYSTIREMVQQSVALLKRQFDSVELTAGKESILSSLGLSSENGESNIPAMLPGIFESTAPSLLHAYVRVLGLANDRAGLLELLRLMSKREAGLKFSANERMGGKRLVRRTVVAIRVFLEGDWELTSGVSEPGASYTSPALKHRSFICEGNNPVNSDISESTQKARAFVDPIVIEAYDIIENTELLSPWPTDGEIKEYKAVLTGLRR